MFEVLAKISVQRSTAPIQAPVKKFIDQALDTISDDKMIHFQDVKTAYPEISDKLKALFFANSNKITVKDLKKLVKETPEADEKFWLSVKDWKGDAQKAFSTVQKVIRLNFTPQMAKLIDSNPAAAKFFPAIFEHYKTSAHPTEDHTFAWARVYMMPDLWIIEEIQTDYAGWDKDFSAMTDTLRKIIDQTLTKEEQLQLHDFFKKHLAGWERKFLATIVDMARKDKVNKVYIFDEEFKKGQTSMSPSKAKHFYKNLPRDLGFKKETTMIGNKNYPVWTRVVASSRKLVENRYRIRHLKD